MNKKKSGNILIILYIWASANVMQQGIIISTGEQGLLLYIVYTLNITSIAYSDFSNKNVWWYIVM